MNNKAIIYLNKKPSDTDMGTTSVEAEATSIINVHTDCATPFIEILKCNGTDTFELVEVQ